MASVAAAHTGIGTTRRSLDLVPTVAGQRQGYLATRVYEPSGAGAAADITSAETRCYHAVCQQRGSRRFVHAIADRWSFARSRTGAGMVLVLARRSPRVIRLAGRGIGYRRHHPGPHLHRGADDGTDWTGPFLYPADAAGGGDGHFGGADHRTPLDLRCPSDR